MNTRLCLALLAVAALSLPALADGSAIAFYTFNDAAAGADASSVAAITNSIDGSTYAGTATVNGGGSLEFSADAPGAYILDGVDGAVLATGPQSLDFNGGQIDFDGIMTALSTMMPAAADQEFTIEFFWKKPTSLAGNDAKAKVLGANLNGSTKNLSIYMPGTNACNVQLYIQANRYLDLSGPMQDGKWHHFAVTCKKNASTPQIEMLHDYAVAGNDNYPSGFTGATGPLSFSPGYGFRGLISCVRVTARKLSADEMMRAAATPMYDPGDDDVQVDAVTPKGRWDSQGGWWATRLEEKAAEIAERGDEIETVFLGDSITQLWTSYGSTTWPRFSEYHPLNIGYTADTTGHVLYRIENGELDGYRAKAVVLLIGTNNIGKEPLRHTWRGIKAIVEAVRAKQPQAKVFLHALFPRDDGSDAEAAAERSRKIRVLNGELAKLADGVNVVWVDLHDMFLNQDGTLNGDLYYTDRLHLFQAGYAMWADQLLPLLDAACFGPSERRGALRADTVAFYPFDDAPVGTCLTNRTVRNAADPSRFGGTSELYESSGFAGTARCEIGGDGPAKYVFDGRGLQPSLFVVNPRSLLLAGRTKVPSAGGTVQSGAAMRFAGLATEILSNTDYTVEFFYKIPTTASDFNFFSPTVSWAPDGKYCGLSLPVHNSGSDTMRSVRLVHSTTSTGKPTVLLQYESSLKDDLWHHIAAVRKAGKLRLYCDYRLTTSEVADETEVLDVQKPLVIGDAYRFQGNVSCLRVTTNALSAAEFLYASDSLEANSPTVFHWIMDGTPGETCSVITNAVPADADALAGQYCSRFVSGNGSLVDATRPMVFTNDIQRKKLVCAGETQLHTNTASGWLPFSANKLPTRLQLGVDAHLPIKGGSFTFETFFRFEDRAAWEAHRDKGTTYCSIAGKPCGDAAADWWCGLWVYLKGYIVAQIKTTGGTVDISPLCTIPYDGRWHHYAFVYDEEALEARLYLDYEPMGATPVKLPGPMDSSADPAYDYLLVGGGMGWSSFGGVLDEVRYSRVALAPEQFLKLDRIPSGLQVIFR